MKLALGTVQFGINYGINNTQGKISRQEAAKILKYAWNHDITVLDTASAYGNSEEVLGETIQELGGNYQIITKYPANQSARPFDLIDQSLKLLHTKKIYAYLFHSFSSFKKHKEYIEDFIKIKDIGKSDKIGFSLYYPDEAKYILDNNIPCDIVQVPYSIFDQRFTDIFHELYKNRIEIHVRSIFLQGLFFIQPDKLPDYFMPVKESLKLLHNFVEKNNIGISALCLGFVKKNQYIDKMIIGVDSLNNLKNNIDSYNDPIATDVDFNKIEMLAVTNENIILPFNWK